MSSKEIKRDSRVKKTVIDAPVAFTKTDLERYEYWLALQSCIPWLYEEPKDKFTKDTMRDFMALYAKVKMSMQAVVPGKVNVKVGKSPTSGHDLVITGGWYETAQAEADFAVSFFTAYLSNICGSDALKNLASKVEKQIKIYQGRIRQLEEDKKRRDMRILDLENAVEKMVEREKTQKRKSARSQSRKGK